jgi:hypothetical protein
MDAALNQQLIKAVNPLYLRTLQHQHTGFTTSTTQNLIVHLLTSYGDITPTNLAHNDTVFRKPYDSTQPIEAFYSQIEDVMDYADAGKSAYTAAQVVTNAYSLIFTTGMFHKRKPGTNSKYTSLKPTTIGALHKAPPKQKDTMSKQHHGLLRQ